MKKIIIIGLMLSAIVPANANDVLGGKTIDALQRYFVGCENVWPQFRQLALPYYVHLRKLLIDEHYKYNMIGDIGKIVDYKTNLIITMSLSRINNPNPYKLDDTPSCYQFTDLNLVETVLGHYVDMFEQSI